MPLGSGGMELGGKGLTREGQVGLTRGRRGGGLVILRLASLPEHTVDLQHVHPLAQLMLELRQPLLCGDLLPRQPLHLMLVFLLLPLQRLDNSQETEGYPEQRPQGPQYRNPFPLPPWPPDHLAPRGSLQ